MVWCWKIKWYLQYKGTRRWTWCSISNSLLNLSQEENSELFNYMKIYLMLIFNMIVIYIVDFIQKITMWCVSKNSFNGILKTRQIETYYNTERPFLYEILPSFPNWFHPCNVSFREVSECFPWRICKAFNVNLFPMLGRYTFALQLSFVRVIT